ncbi:MAG: hypothetical protein J7501_09105 [Bdellovibrio sp.]|nr:hypothetical protein [Bdellovibrio sp.]
MGVVESIRSMFYDEEVRFRSSVSESLMAKIARSVNFINTAHTERAVFTLSGNYSPANPGSLPFLGIDQSIIFAKNSEIVAVNIWNRKTGATGTTELDIKWKPQVGGVWQSIFSTTPKFNSSVADFTACGIGDTVAGFVAPVLTKTNYDAKDMIRMDLLQAVSGQPNGCSLEIIYRPR